MKKFSLGLVLAAALTGPTAWAAALPESAVITGLYNGAASGLLGLDSNFAAVPGSNTTALSAGDLEFIAADFSIGIDFLTDGSVVVYDNTGLGSLPGSTTLAFDFSGLGVDLDSFTLSDTAGITSGAITPLRVNAHAVTLSFSDLVFSVPFGSFTTQLGTLAPVPEPGSMALTAGGLAALALLAAARRPQR